MTQAPCPSCGAPTVADQRFCRNCGQQLAPAGAEPEATTPVAPAPLQAPATRLVAPRGEHAPAPYAPPPKRRWPLVAAILGAIAFAGGVGAGVVLLGSSQDGDTTAAQTTPARATTTAPALPAGEATQSVTLAAPTEQPTTSAPTEQPTTSAPTEQPTTSAPTAQTATTSAPPPPPPPPPAAQPVTGSGDSPAAQTMLGHWRAIAAGQYDRAYSYFSSDYAVSRADWVRVMRATPPAVDIDGIVVRDTQRTLGADRLVRVNVVTRDPGQPRCNRATGIVVVRSEGGRWRYQPGRLKGSTRFTVRSQSVSASDPACARIV